MSGVIIPFGRSYKIPPGGLWVVSFHRAPAGGNGSGVQGSSEYTVDSWLYSGIFPGPGPKSDVVSFAPGSQDY